VRRTFDKMKTTLHIIIIIFFFATMALAATDPATEVWLIREMVSDAAIRFDDAGLMSARERALLLAAAADASGNIKLARDAHYLAALSAWAQINTGNNDMVTLRRLAAEGIAHADRAAALDDHDADAFALAALLHGNTFALGVANSDTRAQIRAQMMERYQKAAALDAHAPGVMLINGLIRSMNPAGPARPEGVQAFADFVKQLDAKRTPADLWDVSAHSWLAFVQLQNEHPDAASMREPIAQFVAMRPDSVLAKQLAARVEHHAWANVPNDLTWKTIGSDPAGDGAAPNAPELRTLDVARGGDRIWFRATYEQPLPQSFGVNFVIDRDGDPDGDMLWWSTKSHVRFDRLVTAWITREGDGYFGIVGVSDANGTRARQLTKFSTDVLLRVDGKSVIAAVPASVLDLTPNAKMIAAGGTNLIWSDDLTGANGDAIAFAP